MIPVTKPFLPPKSELLALYEGIYDRQWLTNHGPLVTEFENKFPEAISFKGYFSYVTNGTIALQIAIKVLELSGEIITTPFSYVATTSSIVWEGCKPVFVDIEKDTCNMDVTKIEAAINNKTSAILATHVYGNPCDIEAIEKIARKYNLKVIYDAAHCVGTKYKGKSVFEYGDISTTSFHATKLFQTVEGGGVFTQDKDLFDKISYHRNFGHKGQEEFWGLGINGKNSEFHAAMGIANLPYLYDILKRRKRQWLFYSELIGMSDVSILKLNEDCDFNYAYFPIFFNSEQNLLKAKNKLEVNGIFPRRYFYPSLNSLNYVSNAKMPISVHNSYTALTLPLYDDLSQSSQKNIINLLREC